ncbi:MAG: citrate synthase [bacterium]|nr:citrate synthase [bacterium]
MAQAKLILDDKEYKFPIVVGTENEKAIDISTLRSKTGFVTLDNGFQNTGSCSSAITYIDGENGILRYRGIPIEQLAYETSFVETSHLLIYGNLPTKKESEDFSRQLTMHSMIHEDMINFFTGFPPTAHPMAILSAMVGTLSVYYPRVFDLEHEDEEQARADEVMTIARLLAKVRTIAAFSYKKSIGEPFIYPQKQFKYCENILNMMFASETNYWELDKEMVKILNLLLILHGDHEQNCSTSTVRLVGSSRVNLFSSVCAGICALWGPLHGGANQRVIETLEMIHHDNNNVKKYVDKAKDKDNPFRLMGFGHRVYKNYDPRAKILKKVCADFFGNRKINDPLLDIALKLEEIALKDDFFVSKNLYPNVDFYSGILYRAMNIPTDMFTVMFALGRLPGWIAQWKEMHETVPFKIGRPRQVYTGPGKRDIVPKPDEVIEDK